MISRCPIWLLDMLVVPASISAAYFAFRPTLALVAICLVALPAALAFVLEARQ
jgi:hypothetical protein